MDCYLDADLLIRTPKQPDSRLGTFGNSCEKVR